MSEPFIGEVMLVGWNFAARGWSLCNGQLLSISSNTALFSLLGTTFGGDGRTTFGLPDLQGRVPVGVGNGPGLTPVTWGQKGGVNRVTLNTTEIPSHNHGVRLNAENTNANQTAASGNILANTGSAIYATPNPRADVPMAADAVTQNNVGGSQSHENMQPYLGMYYEIALVGLFPSRS